MSWVQYRVYLALLSISGFLQQTIKLDQSIFKNTETPKEMFMCFGVLVKSMKIKLTRGYLQTEISLASTACNQVEKNLIFLSSHAGC